MADRSRGRAISNAPTLPSQRKAEAKATSSSHATSPMRDAETSSRPSTPAFGRYDTEFPQIAKGKQPTWVKKGQPPVKAPPVHMQRETRQSRSPIRPSRSPAPSTNKQEREAIAKQAAAKREAQVRAASRQPVFLRPSAKASSSSHAIPPPPAPPIEEQKFQHRPQQHRKFFEIATLRENLRQDFKVLHQPVRANSTCGQRAPGSHFENLPPDRLASTKNQKKEFSSGSPCNL